MWKAAYFPVLEYIRLKAFEIMYLSQAKHFPELLVYQEI